MPASGMVRYSVQGSGFPNAHLSVHLSNICKHPSIDPAVPVCNSETLLDTFTKLGSITCIKQSQLV